MGYGRITVEGAITDGQHTASCTTDGQSTGLTVERHLPSGGAEITCDRGHQVDPLPGYTANQIHDGLKDQLRQQG